MFYRRGTANLHLFSRVLLLLGYLPDLHAQTNSTPSIGCTLTTQWAWSENIWGYDPCDVALLLFEPPPHPCNDSGLNFYQLTTTDYYPPPNASDANQCLCNTVIYSLFSACGLCQGKSFLYWSEWISACPASETLYQIWPANISSDASVPAWAFMPLYNGYFDANLASINAFISGTFTTAVLLSTNYPTPSTTFLPYTSSAVPSSNTSSNTKSAINAGAISGEVIGGVVGVAIIAFVIIFLWHRRRSQKPEYETETKIEGGEQEYYDRSSTALSGFSGPRNGLPKLYNPNDPTTFPPSSSLSTNSRTNSGLYTGAAEPMISG
ncbi:hypothetical protein BJ138DRAFT_1114559 [Hygrophoropsis aurantiaca]|uniref:Uncharacterized protein n=1 Tax=Hygrophoropsis aurantiaca TaxID=72124 RepID=A0ACB8A9Q4_9AGAM|nr:hypothetical protein BJ138DRAFT_1114559 [Hygrophoropsis aurantiaca]